MQCTMYLGATTNGTFLGEVDLIVSYEEILPILVTI